ncbi:MAG: aminodeoxychorismate synthase component I [Chloroflexi bacterium]|nr:aminodeoxychorismate synthase component I [Chloroflexota bacterium]
MNNPLVTEIKRSLNPLQVFSDLFKGRDYSFWLDSGMDKTKLGRYSFIGGDPFLVMTSCGREITLDAGGGKETLQGDPFIELYRLTERYSIKNTTLPVPFGGGAVGYFGYDLCHFIEKLSSRADKDINLPECFFAFYDVVVAFDHLEGKTYILSSGFPETDTEKRKKRAAVRLEEVKRQLETIIPLSFDATEETDEAVEANANFSREEYINAVEKARRYIIKGDIFEVNLSQRFKAQLKVEPFTLYRRLRQINPAPFACFLSMSKGQAVVSASPERFLKITKDRVETRPIKGTRSRGSTPAEDEMLAQELLASVKDRAENMMIVDLSRNDLGRVCRYGTVKVSELAILEKYPTVFHLTSTIEGRLRQDKDWHDVIRAAFPGGSITGAPKIRSMEIIDEIEPTARSVYTGNIGYIGFNGDIDLNIAIRTFIIDDGQAYFQVGGAVTYDSEAEKEYTETLDKAKALFGALGLEEK